MAGLVEGALLGAGLNELILLVKRAYRCRGACKKLEGTLKCVEELLPEVTESSERGNVACNTWLEGLHSLLEEAKGVVQKCVKDGGWRVSFVNKFTLSPKIQDVEGRIREMISMHGNLVILTFVKGIDDKVTPAPEIHQEPAYELQQVPPHIVLFDNDPFKRLKDLILLEPSDGVKSIGIKGGGGAGKTLLAKMLNNDEDIQKKYGVGSILWITVGQDVSVASVYERMGKFLKDERFDREICRRHLEEQRNYLMEAFKRKNALLILDDMWENFEKSHAMIYWLDICKGNGSTTVITTRDNKVLDRAQVKKRIEVKSLSEKESWKLFSFHAFQANIPPSIEVRGIAMEICSECKGLPLALEVIGGALWDAKDIRNWKHALTRLKKSEMLADSASIENELFHRLKFSYDVLSDDAKKCFLYFAAFPEDYGVPIEELCSIWQAEKLFGSSTMEETLNTGRMNLITLADRSLVSLKYDGLFARVHDVLRDLAMRIIREAKPGEWAYECQFEPGKILETLPEIKETTKRVSFMGTHIMRFDSQLCKSFQNLQVCLIASLTFDHESGFPVSLPRDLFLGMTNLLYLSLYKCESLKELPESIKEVKSLTHLYLRACKSLKELPESIKELRSLTHLDLRSCESLMELPESIKELKSLTHLDLRGCKSLKELPESIKELKSLSHLDLRWCESLKELPESIKELKSLTHLYLRGCKSLKELPESIKELRSLTHLDLSSCESLMELPESIKELKSLTHLDLRGCKSLKELPESIKELKSLSHLDLSFCKSLKELPGSIKELKSLTFLDLSFCESLMELPESIKELKSVTRLKLCWCESLMELPESIKELKSLTHLDLRACRSLKELPESIKELKSLSHLDLRFCESLMELRESIKELKSLTHLYLEGCKSLMELPESIKELKSLTHLDLSSCESLKELPESIKELKFLTHLKLWGCKSLKELPESIKEVKSLSHLDLSWCESLMELPESIEELKSLTHLYLRACKSLKELPESIKELKSLTHLDLRMCESLKELLESIKELKSLTHLDLSSCESLKEVPESIKELKSLTHLDLRCCKSLKELPESIKELKSLTHLDLGWCESLKELPESIKELKSLTHLNVWGCKSLKELPESIKELTSPSHLDLSWTWSS